MRHLRSDPRPRKRLWAPLLVLIAVFSAIVPGPLFAEPGPLRAIPPGLSEAPCDVPSACALNGPIRVSGNTGHDEGPPLAAIPARHDASPYREPRAVPGRDDRNPAPNATPGSSPNDLPPAGSGPSPSPTAGFNGISYATGGTGAPPDTNGDVGPSHYIQTVNGTFQVFTKAGASLYGPASINTIWAGFGGDCEARNDGDPIVQYDHLADRWFITQFAIAGPYYQCVAVSTTADPLGSWYRYAFKYDDLLFNDYAKIGVWSDGYYMSTNDFSGNSNVGFGVSVFERQKMLAGQPARLINIRTSAPSGPLLPADLDGLPPPAGTPNYFVSFTSGSSTHNTLDIWELHADWTNPANSTWGLGGLPNQTLTVANYTEICPATRACIPQSGSADNLDALSDRPMYAFAVRYEGGAVRGVFNRTVDAGSGRAGIRVYQLAKPGASPWIVEQDILHAPAGTLNRWMGSVRLDKGDNLLLGYSTSSSTTFPSIAWAGRLAGDPANTLGQTETSVKAGTGAQTGTSNRWGDYSMMALDVDGCTFWYTTEYISSPSGSFNWKTWIASTKYAGCAALSNATPSTTSLSIASATQGAAPLVIVVSGTNFVPGSVCRFNGANRLSDVISSTQLRCYLTAADFTTAAGFPITVFNPAINGVGGGLSGAQTFTVNPLVSNPAPVTTNATPNTFIGGAPASTIVVDGSNFVGGSVARWDGGDRATVVNSSTQIEVAILASDLTTEGTHALTVFNGGPGGGLSNAQGIVVQTGVTAISPASGSRQGGTNYTLSGGGFHASPTVYFGPKKATAAFVNSGSITGTTPPRPQGGLVPVNVINTNGSFGASTFQYLYGIRSANVGTGSPDVTGETSGTWSANGRPARDGVPSTCGTTPKAFPGTFGTGGRTYDAYTFTNTDSSSRCVTFQWDTVCTGTDFLFVSIYSTFNPANIATGYLADQGTSQTANTTFSFNVAAGASFTVVVMATNSGGGCASPYTFNLAGLTNEPIAEHELSAVAIGAEVAVFGRNAGGQLWYRETAGGGATWGNWTNVAGAIVDSRPEAVLGADGGLYVFYRGLGNDLRYVKRTGGVWGAEQSLGGVIVGNPVAALDGDGDLIVAMLNSVGETFSIRLSSGTWGPFTLLSGILTGQLDLATYNGDVYLFGLNGAGLLWTKQWTATSDAWGAWTPLDGVLSSAPAATVLGSDLYVLAVNPAGGLWYRALSGGLWGGWTPLDGILGASPDAVTFSARLISAAANPAGILFERSRSGGSWAPWASLDGVLIAGPEQAASTTGAYTFGINGTGNLWYRMWNGSAWGAWTNLGGQLSTQ